MRVHLAAVVRQSLVAIDADHEVPPFGQVQRHRDPGAVAERGLLFPEVAQAWPV